MNIVFQIIHVKRKFSINISVNIEIIAMVLFLGKMRQGNYELNKIFFNVVILVENCKITTINARNHFLIYKICLYYKEHKNLNIFHDHSRIRNKYISNVLHVHSRAIMNTHQLDETS